MIVMVVLGGALAAFISYLLVTNLTPSVQTWMISRRSAEALLHPLDLIPMEEMTTADRRHAQRARKSLEEKYDEKMRALKPSKSKAAITASKQEPVPTPLSMSLPEGDLAHLTAFALHVEETRREAEKSRDTEWLREVLILRNRLAENVQAFQDASVAGAPDEEAVEAFLTNVRHMESHLQGLLQVRVKDAKKKLRTLTSYYENRAEEETPTPA